MMRSILTLLLLCCSVWDAAAFSLSDRSRISILTCSPGNELYSLFGHTAIRVEDPLSGTDVVFNYGTFDFDTPHFYWKYAKGLLPYQLTVAEYPDFLNAYRREGRTVYAQTLRLDSLHKRKLLDLLLENYRPANRSYLYNFLFDNCTTRSRDIVLKSLPDTVQWRLPDAGKSFWHLLDEYLRVSPWVQWGIHTILGQRGNREATVFQYMFLPDYLMYGLDSALYRGQPLAGQRETLCQAPVPDTRTPWYLSPLFVFTAGVLVVIVLLQTFKKKGLLRFVAFSFFLFSGAVGGLIVFLGAFTAHPMTAPNWNVLWANPLNLPVLPFLFKRRLPGLVRGYLKIYLALLALAIPAWAVWQPAVPLASVSLMVGLIYLSFRLRAE